MACRYTYNGTTYSASEFIRVLSDLPPVDASKFMPGVNPVPNAPCVNNTDEWAMLAFKRMVVWAAEHGLDRIAWTTGEQQAARYALGHLVERIDVMPWGDGDRTVQVYIRAQRGGRSGFTSLYVNHVGHIIRAHGHDALDGATGKKLDEVLGKEVAEKIMAAKDNQTFAGNDLRIGDAGMRGFYDDILPRSVNKWAKKFGGEVGQSTIEKAGVDDIVVSRRGDGWAVIDGDTDAVLSEHATNAAALAEANRAGAQKRAETTTSAVVHALDVTDAMRDAALAGLPLFRRQASEVGSPEFRHWFCDSKVVDANGDPLVVYHGTKSGAFHTFREGDEGIFFAESESTARFYAGGGGIASASGRIVPAYLSLSNPLRMTWREWLGGVTDGGIQHGLIGTEGLVEHGYDGVILSEPDADDPAANSTTYIVFRPEQIKSAVDNNGAFDPENPDIRFRRNAMLPETIESMKP